LLAGDNTSGEGLRFGHWLYENRDASSFAGIMADCSERSCPDAPTKITCQVFRQVERRWDLNTDLPQGQVNGNRSADDQSRSIQYKPPLLELVPFKEIEGIGFVSETLPSGVAGFTGDFAACLLDVDTLEKHCRTLAEFSPKV
jgi:hypothetical protein